MLFRYPGSKSKISGIIVKHILKMRGLHPFTSYCEPFFGGGSVCFRLLEKSGPTIKSVWINDIDAGIFSIWWSVVNEPERFKELVHAFKPSRKAFSQFKRELTAGKNFPLPELALKKLAMHQMSYSGLGTMAGGPLTKIASRWSPDWIDKNIDRARHLLAGRDVVITNLDYRQLVPMIDENYFLYFDPPYVGAGNQLYQYSFDEYDHQKLRELLTHAKFPWALSYNNHCEVRRMYGHEVIHQVPILYTINGVVKKNELLITPGRYSEILHDLWGLNGRTIPATLPLIPFAGKYMDFDVSSHLELHDFFTSKHQESSNIESSVLGVD